VTPGSSVLVIDPGHALATANFARHGGDLRATWDDGAELTVRGYFDQDEPARLTTPHGEALSGALVARLAGPLAPGQVAQTDPLTADLAVGQVTTVEGEATATRPDGTVVPLAAGTPIGQGDVLATGDGAALAVTFADNTRFSLGASARMVVDEFVYDPGGGANTAAFDVLQGVFVFVSGEVAHTGDDSMTLTTPVATIGIRGTALALRIVPVGLQSLISLLPDPDGDLGSVTVATAVDTVILDDENEATTVTSLDAPPGSPFVLSPAQLTDIFGAILASLGLAPADGEDEQPDETGAEGGQDGEADADDGGADGTLDATTVPGIEVTLAGGLVTTLTPALGPIDVTGALALANLGVIGFATLDSGQKVVAISGLGDDDDIIVFLNVDTNTVGIGTAGNDTFAGSDGSDAFFGAAGNDHLDGLAGNDTLFGDEGNDFINGGDDDDILTGDGLFSGDVGNDVLFGGNGNDVLIGGSSNSFGGLGNGADMLNGGAGDDVLQPGPGVDTYDGGPDQDTLDLTDGTQGAHVDLQAGQTLNDGFGNTEAFTGIENVEGTVSADSLTGSSGANFLFGNEGDDALFGAQGDDMVLGGSGNDILGGGVGQDTLMGDDGPGDAGADVFSYGDKFDGGQVAANVTRGAVSGDTILDFVSGEDTIKVNFLDFGVGLGGLGPLVLGQNFSVIGAQYDSTNPGANSNFSGAQPTFVFSTADDTLYFDDNGPGAGYTVIATFANGEAPVAGDFDVAFGA
jgi:Ca2+-binding RTX toxin-like protein